MLDGKDMTATDPAASNEPEMELRDESGAIRQDYVDRVSEAIEQSRSEVLRDLVGDLHEADVGELLEALEPDLRPRLIQLLGADFDFSALTEVDDAVREEILEELPAETVAEGVRDLDSDDAVYILEDLPQEERDEILEQLPLQERVELARGLLYPENSAGRRMQTDFVAVPPDWDVGRTIDYLRGNDDLPERFYDLYVTDPNDRLRGAVPLDHLLRARRQTPIADLVEEDLHKVKATEDQEEVARMFTRYNLVAAPVVDEEGRLVGTLTFDDVADFIEQEAEEDLMALGGIRSAEELSDTVGYTVRSRFPWLFVNLLTALISAWVISRFQSSLEKMVALAVVMPIVASMGGNAGTQTMTVAVRALATRNLSRANAWRVARREFTVGVLNGMAFAIILGTVAATWFQVPQLGIVVGLAITTVLAAAGLGGLLIPLALTRMGVDPAVSSGPFVTTITDVIGFFAFLGIATLWFHLA